MDGEKELVCNVCGRALVVENGIPKEDFLEGVKEWGYFSKKDLEVHKFIICEECYDKLIQSFVMPVTVVDKQEVL